MADVVYVPFDDPRLLMQGYKIARSNGLGAAKGPHDSTAFANLDGTLTILAHSGRGNPKLYATASGGASISAKRLAADLVEKGLSHRCKGIEVFACHGGSPGGVVKGLSKVLRTTFKLLMPVGGFSTPVGSVNSTGQQQVVLNVQGTGRNARIIRPSRRH